MNQEMVMHAGQFIDMTYPNRIISRLQRRAASMLQTLRNQACLMDSRLRAAVTRSDQGAATAEYAVVLIAATGFAALLVALLKSDTVKMLLTDLVSKALNVG